MTKRNFILLIVILALTVISVLVFLVLREPGTEPSGEETGKGTNFISQFNPFATKPKPPAENPPAETTPDELPVETEKLKFTKVSSMPIAGFAVFTKERLKDVPAIIPAITEETPYDFGSATIKNGSTGEAVKEVQRFLNKTLNLSLELDGKLNAETIDKTKTTANKLKTNTLKPLFIIVNQINTI